MRFSQWLRLFIFFIILIIAIFFSRYRFLLRPQNEEHENFGLKLNHPENSTAFLVFKQLGQNTLDKVVSDPKLQPTFSSVISRSNHVSEYDERLTELRKISGKQIQCAIHNHTQKFPALLFYKPKIHKKMELALYINYFINALHYVHYARANEGARCGEMVGIASLHILQHMLETQQCINLQQRKIIVPHHKKKNTEDEHVYLLISPWTIPTGRLNSFSQKQQGNTFILDPFADIFISVKDSLSDSSRYPYYQEKHPDDGFISPWSLHCPDSKSMTRISKNYEMDFNTFFFATLQHINKVFSEQATQLPLEFVCDASAQQYAYDYVERSGPEPQKFLIQHDI